MKKYQGFTLIETLLVIAILGMLVAIGIAYHQKHTRDMKVNKTVQQIQQILQAANAFYKHKDCWPGSDNCPGDLSAYAPAGIVANPWGNSYILQPISPDGKAFEVIASKIPIPFAQRVAKKLPNAATQNCDANDCNIVVQIPVPGPQ
jgi:prepilin-type N-terminal cleavage/methylation domain-containing protein